MPREKGPEWDYVTLVQHEGTDGVKQWKNKRQLCELLHVFHGGAMRIRLHFLQVPGCGVPSVQQLRTLGMRRGRRRGGSRKRSPAVLTSTGRVGLQAKKSTTWEVKVSQGLPNDLHLRILPCTPTATSSVHEYVGRGLPDPPKRPELVPRLHVFASELMRFAPTRGCAPAAPAPVHYYGMGWKHD
eukprot:1161466-Pelagomonas_calceolata.AAC.12